MQVNRLLTIGYCDSCRVVTSKEDLELDIAEKCKPGAISQALIDLPIVYCAKVLYPTPPMLVVGVLGVELLHSRPIVLRNPQSMWVI